MNSDEKERDKKAESGADNSQAIRKVSKVIFDKKTGTLTLTLEKEEMKNEKNEK